MTPGSVAGRACWVDGLTDGSFHLGRCRVDVIVVRGVMGHIVILQVGVVCPAKGVAQLLVLASTQFSTVYLPARPGPGEETAGRLVPLIFLDPRRSLPG